MRISFLVLAGDVNSTHYSRLMCVCTRAEEIFLIFIQILYLIIIRPRIRRATVLVTMSATVKANFSSSSAFSSSCSPCSSSFNEFLFAVWITFLPYFLFIIFSLYEHLAYEHEFTNTPTYSYHDILLTH